MSARKPGPFKVAHAVAAECFERGAIRWVRTWMLHLDAKDSARLAAWLTRAAAWCKEGN